MATKKGAVKTAPKQVQAPLVLKLYTVFDEESGELLGTFDTLPQVQTFLEDDKGWRQDPYEDIEFQGVQSMLIHYRDEADMDPPVLIIHREDTALLAKAAAAALKYFKSDGGLTQRIQLAEDLAAQFPVPAKAKK